MGFSDDEVFALQKGLKRKEKELSLLYRLHQSLASGYLEHLLGLIVNLTSELVQCKICSVMILDADKDELVVRATQSLDDEYIRKKPVKTAQSLSGLAILERRTQQFYDVSKDQRFTYRAMAQRLGLRSLLTVPMMIRNRPIGVINFYTTSPRRFSEDEVRLLEAIASQAAIALERDELARKAERAQAFLEERRSVERAKGILMQKRRLPEKRAYELLRKASMTSRKSMKEIAEAIILAEKL